MTDIPTFSLFDAANSNDDSSSFFDQLSSSQIGPQTQPFQQSSTFLNGNADNHVNTATVATVPAPNNTPTSVNTFTPAISQSHYSPGSPQMQKIRFEHRKSASVTEAPTFSITTSK